MRMENKGGDTLASGGVRCQFRAAGSNVTQEAWDKIWSEDSDAKNDGGNADVQTDGDAGASAGKIAAVPGI